MARVRFSPCAEPGCPELTASGRCEDHRLAQRRKAEAGRPSASQRGYDEAWRRTRAAFLKVYPVCEQCPEPATDVDHRDGRGPHGPLGHHWPNLQALCHSHHSRKTVREDGGFGRGASS